MTEYKVIVHGNGKVFWRNKKSELHREGDLPAIILPDGDEWYYINDKLHRENGPAITRPNGDEEYWINGSRLTKEEFEARNKPKHEGQVGVVDGVEYELKAKGE